VEVKSFEEAWEAYQERAVPPLMTEEQFREVYTSITPLYAQGCPDGGMCHHECREACFRVQYCGPLSNKYPGDTWPDEIKAKHPIEPRDREDEELMDALAERKTGVPPTLPKYGGSL
jgi:hypothetical protein